jgi:hypothetical protein
MKTATFKDFSKELPPHWVYQAGNPDNDDVTVFLDKTGWCREIKNVRVIEHDGWLMPLPGQLVTYSRRK